ncbi:MAG: hypothetical protein MI802_19005, partial [Desulfobacterales bacterium]|nr:hypothetical protein [Desulfobacterales bacterium]
MGRFKGSVKFRLVGGFLFCALLTAVSGGAGIVSLNQISGMMASTAEEITGNIDSQHRQLQQLTSVRGIVNRTLGTEQTEDIHLLMEKYREMRSAAPGDLSAFKEIYLETRSLIETKQQQLETREALRQGLSDILAQLERITQLTRDSVSASETESVTTIEDEISGVVKKLRTLLENPQDLNDERNGERILMDAGILDSTDELMMTAEMSISAVRAAMSVQAVTIRQQELINRLFHATTKADITAIKEKVTLFSKTLNSDLVELPEDD